MTIAEVEPESQEHTVIQEVHVPVTVIGGTHQIQVQVLQAPTAGGGQQLTILHPPQ